MTEEQQRQGVENVHLTVSIELGCETRRLVADALRQLGRHLAAVRKMDPEDKAAFAAAAKKLDALAREPKPGRKRTRSRP